MNRQKQALAIMMSIYAMTIVFCVVMNYSHLYKFMRFIYIGSIFLIMAIVTALNVFFLAEYVGYIQSLFVLLLFIVTIALIYLNSVIV